MLKSILKFLLWLLVIALVCAAEHEAVGVET